MQAMRGFTGGGAPQKYPLSGKKIKVLHIDPKSDKKNIILGKMEVGMKKAFTLAEVLITLGIIGIVAAMTMPMLIGKYKKQVTVTQLKKAYTVLSQMVLQAQEDNGPAYFSSNSNLNADEVKNFFELYWLPYFNNPTVSKEGEFPYEIRKPYTYMSGVTTETAVYTIYSAGRIFFSANDGVSYFVLIVAYGHEYDEEGNPVDIYKYANRQTVYVDIDGIKGENTLGKDVFVFVVNFDQSIVRPLGYDKTVDEINQNCSHTGNGDYCAAKIMYDGWEIADDYKW